jgi:hypothetical protein
MQEGTWPTKKENFLKKKDALLKYRLLSCR